ncbi:MAG: hypothetical protein H0X17_03390 [Deltaproteobacteria bacterium]|nr:hypothetical protein [Deltaproteobacteria bacterium]
MAHRVLTVQQAGAALWPRGIQVHYRSPTEQERRALTELVGTLWGGVTPPAAPELAVLALQARMELELWTIEGRPTWVVREAADEPRGLGIYLVHAAAAPRGRPILLQAPHVYFDRQTQYVAAAMFWATGVPDQIHGLFTNSVHRFQRAESVRDRRAFNPADVAHNSEHPFQSATSAVVEHGPVVVIQLHGFDGESRSSTVTAIVSAARPEGSTAESSHAASTLHSVVGAAVARYPEETKSYGGLGNVQGRLVATSTDARFVHIELELGLRKRMTDPALAARWVRALVDAIESSRTP